MVEGLLLNDSARIGEELQEEIVLAGLTGMHDAVSRRKILSIESDYVVLTRNEACGTDIHSDSQGREGVGARNANIVDHAHQGITCHCVGRRPDTAVPSMVVEDHSHLESHQDIVGGIEGKLELTHVSGSGRLEGGPRIVDFELVGNGVLVGPARRQRDGIDLVDDRGISSNTIMILDGHLRVN